MLVTFDITTEKEIDAEQMREDISDILKNTSDFQHSNIHLGLLNGIISVDAWTEDFRDHSRSRKALEDTLKYILDAFT